jgi:hypothetical protein
MRVSRANRTQTSSRRSRSVFSPFLKRSASSRRRVFLN